MVELQEVGVEKLPLPLDGGVLRLPPLRGVTGFFPNVARKSLFGPGHLVVLLHVWQVAIETKVAMLCSCLVLQ